MNSDLISRQAAIELIERMKPYHQEADDIAEMIDNMPSAQPELTQNLHNACTDLISRQEVIKLLDEAWVDGHEYQGWLHDDVNRLPSAQPEPLKITIDDVPTADELERIKQAMRITPVIVFPSAHPERKNGEWTKNNSCPFCGFLPWYERDIHTLSFCPNCGADMRGEGGK